MAKRCIGIDIGSSHIRAIQIISTPGQFHIEKLFSSQMRRTTDSPERILRTLVAEQGFDHRAALAVVMPRQGVFYRNIETDSAGLEKLRSSDLSAVKNAFPIEPDQTISQVYSCCSTKSGGYRVLTAATSRETLQETLNNLSVAKLKPALVDSVVFAIHSALVINHPELTAATAVIAYIEESILSLAVVQNNSISVVRNIPFPADENDNAAMTQQLAGLLTQEVLIALQKAFGDKKQHKIKLYLVGDKDLCENLAAQIQP